MAQGIVFERHKTAIERTDLSRPVRTALECGLISADRTFFDFGCGRGGDIERLTGLGITASGWDPVHRPATAIQAASVVNLGFVVNVIEDPLERTQTLKRAWSLAQEVLLVAARLTVDARNVDGGAFGDGCVTACGTFQKYFTQEELRSWIEDTLGVPAVAAAPGIMIVFRSEEDRQSYLSQRVRTRIATPRVRKSDRLFEEHRALLEELMTFVADRGRLPDVTELGAGGQLNAVFGSILKAFGIVRRVTGKDQWLAIAERRAEDLLLHLALQRVIGRPVFSALPPAQQRDIREFFSSYKSACGKADELLLSAGKREAIECAMRQSEVGKMTGNALYVHVDFVDRLPTILRVYEGCARQYAGRVDLANIIKLRRGEAKVSYLWYPEFESDPHPELVHAVKVDLSKPCLEFRRYGGTINPPILHRREDFIAKDDDRYCAWHEITMKEEERGLYADTTTIGTRNGWNAVVVAAGTDPRAGG